jgi:hypothetical protein
MSKQIIIIIATVVLASLLVMLTTITTGFTQFINLSPRLAYAHIFTPNESADFLSLIYRIKNEAQLIQSNLLSNASNSRDLAQQHAENTIVLLNQTWTKEIAERNHRVASELTAALIGLKNATATSVKPAPTDIKDKLTTLHNLLGEALSVRLTKDEINNSTIEALALANIINKIDRRYSNAFGVGYNDEKPSAAAAMNMGSMSNAAMSSNGSMSNMDMMSMMKSDQPNLKMTMSSTNNNSHNIVSVSDYQSAQGLINKSQEIFNNVLKVKAPFDKASFIGSLENGLGQLKTAIYAKKPYTDVISIIHTKIHPNLIIAFNLKIA